MVLLYDACFPVSPLPGRSIFAASYPADGPTARRSCSLAALPTMPSADRSPIMPTGRPLPIMPTGRPLPTMPSADRCRSCQAPTAADYAKRRPLPTMPSADRCRPCQAPTAADHAKRRPLPTMPSADRCRLCQAPTAADYAKRRPLPTMPSADRSPTMPSAGARRPCQARTARRPCQARTARRSCSLAALPTMPDKPTAADHAKRRPLPTGRLGERQAQLTLRNVNADAFVIIVVVGKTIVTYGFTGTDGSNVLMLTTALIANGQPVRTILAIGFIVDTDTIVVMHPFATIGTLAVV